MAFCCFDCRHYDCRWSHQMHTNHFRNISKFLEIDGQLLKIGRRAIDVSRMHESIHRHCLVDFFWILISLTFCALLQRFTSFDASTPLTCTIVNSWNCHVDKFSTHRNVKTRRSHHSIIQNRKHSDSGPQSQVMVWLKFSFYVTVALIAPSNGSTDDDLIVDPHGYLAYCPCMGEFGVTHEYG